MKAFKVKTHQQLVKRGTSEEGFLSSGARFNADGGNFQPGPYLSTPYSGKKNTIASTQALEM